MPRGEAEMSMRYDWRGWGCHGTDREGDGRLFEYGILAVGILCRSRQGYHSSMYILYDSRDGSNEDNEHIQIKYHHCSFDSGGILQKAASWVKALKVGISENQH